MLLVIDFDLCPTSTPMGVSALIFGGVVGKSILFFAGLIAIFCRKCLFGLFMVGSDEVCCGGLRTGLGLMIVPLDPELLATV